MHWRAPWLRQRVALLGLAGWDVIAICISYNVIYKLRIDRWEAWTPGLSVIIAAWVSTSYLSGRYSPVGNSLSDYSRHLSKTLIPAVAVVGIFVGHSWLYEIVDAETRLRGFLIPLMAVCIIASAALQTVIFRLRRKKEAWVLLCSSDEKRVLIREAGRLVGDIGVKNGIRFGNKDILSDLVEQKESTAVAVGNIDSLTSDELEDIMKLRAAGNRIIPLIGWCEIHLQRIPSELMDVEWVAQAEGFNLRAGSLSWRLKRLTDIIGATVLLVVTAPIVAVSVSLIWLEDRGPIFYSQIRTGLYGKRIRIWKLRSMRQNAEERGAQWASCKDPRITRIGRFLRATRIDELPQLLNVMGGDLSLIGPRPERPEIEKDLVKYLPNYRVRQWVRPGLSGWAQVCYPYGASVKDSRMKLSYDLFYLRNANMLLDLLIVLKTVKLVAGAKGASPVAERQ